MKKHMFDLSGKVAIVTGATGHLGKAISAGLAEAGSSLAVCSTSLEKAEAFASAVSAEYNIEASGFCLDLRNLSAIDKVISSIIHRFGRIDCLVNNAYYGAPNSLANIKPAEWAMGIDGAVTAHMFMIQACLPHLEQSRGNVINISSMYGMVSPNPGIYEGNPFASPVNYGAGKAALLQLTKYAAVHLAGKGIRVNAISPGPFPSPFVQQNATFIKRLEEKVPLGRIGQPEELKGAVVFLASDSASYVTGHNLVVDGGWTAW
jgi:NAD(P)-dependent dehydrogenase (short-subunit alcohol dehydrogenase family)